MPDIKLSKIKTGLKLNNFYEAITTMILVKEFLQTQYSRIIRQNAYGIF